MNKELSFKGKILSTGRSGGAYVIVPFDVEKEFGKKRVKITAQIENQSYRGSLVRMGTKDHILIITKEIRLKINKTAGDEINIKLKEDTEERIVEIPPDLLAELKKNKKVFQKFSSFSFTHRKEYVNWINEAKKSETRAARIEKLLKTMKDEIKIKS